jgi:crotonobetainyl-CoA:carnitine CoA-transferase CaiB-like acyl-CoA transferase
MTLPLEGILVVAVEQAVAAPLATRHLADLGATVIKVERPGSGDFARGYDRSVNGLSSHFVWLNRNKQSILLDLKDRSDVDVLRQLVARADVLVQNLAPGAFARLGIPLEDLCASHPRLIACSVSGYGAGGPFAERKAYDLIVQAEAGLLSVTGTEEHPAKAGISIADIAAGMYAYSGILTALYERERTGRGRHVSVGLLDAMAEWMGFPFQYGHHSGRRPRRTGSHHPSIAPYGPVVGSDGELLVAVQNEREWRRFCAVVLGDPQLADDPRFVSVADRVENRDALDAAIAGVCAGRRCADLAALLDRAGIAYGAMNDVTALAEHPQLVARERVGRVETERGSIPSFAPVVETDGWTARFDPVPTLGEHTTSIKEWLRAPSLGTAGGGGSEHAGGTRGDPAACAVPEVRRTP